MTTWLANAVALFVCALAVAFLALALLWRIGSWQIAPAAMLTHDEGLRLGSEAPDVAAHGGDNDYHLSFRGRTTFVVFGSSWCAPCQDLLQAAAVHPATRYMRLVHVSDSEEMDLDPGVSARWELYRFHDETSARHLWRAPVSPYFHVIGANGRVAEKGIANRPEHLDRLLSLAPAGVHIAASRTIVGSPTRSPGRPHEQSSEQSS